MTTKEELKQRYDTEKETITFKDYFDGKKTLSFLRLPKYTEENPLIIENYPYGFRLKTNIKYYVEETKRGNRFVSQTLNPKSNTWNKPKKSTYSDVMILVGNEEGHITFLSCSLNDDKTKAQAFLSAFPEILNKEQKISLCRVIGWDEAMQNVTFSVSPSPLRTKEEQEKYDKEQADVLQQIKKHAVYESSKAFNEVQK